METETIKKAIIKKVVDIQSDTDNKETLNTFLKVLKDVAEDMGLTVTDGDMEYLLGSDY